MNNRRTVTHTLRHPATGHGVDFIDSPALADGDAGAMCIMDERDPCDAGFCDRITGRAFWKQLVRKGYRKAA